MTIISKKVEQIGREFKSKQTQLQPLMAELKVIEIRNHETISYLISLLFQFSINFNFI